MNCIPQRRGSPGRPTYAVSGTLPALVMYSWLPVLRTKTASSHRRLFGSKAARRWRSPYFGCVSMSSLKGSKEHAALPGYVAAQCDRPASAGRVLVNGGPAARPFGSVVEAIARRVERRLAAGHTSEVVVVGGVEP